MVRDTNTDIYRGVSYNTPSKLFFVNNTFNTALFCDQFKRKICCIRNRWSYLFSIYILNFAIIGHVEHLSSMETFCSK